MGLVPEQETWHELTANAGLSVSPQSGYLQFRKFHGFVTDMLKVARTSHIPTMTAFDLVLSLVTVAAQLGWVRAVRKTRSPMPCRASGQSDDDARASVAAAEIVTLQQALHEAVRARQLFDLVINALPQALFVKDLETLRCARRDGVRPRYPGMWAGDCPATTPLQFIMTTAIQCADDL